MADLTTLEVSDADLASLVGVSARHIRRLIGSTRTGRNAYQLSDAIPALLEKLPGRVTPKDRHG